MKNQLHPLAWASLLCLSFALTVCARAEDKPAAPEQPQYLFVHNAAKMEAADGRVTLRDVNDQTIFFSDRPDRIAGHTPTSQFVKEWAVGEDNFKDNPPNATLAVFDGEGEPSDAVVVLSNPVLNDGDLTYDIKILEGSVPESGEGCSLFIDIIGRPMTPVSVAGVARRTTRRHIVFGTAVAATAVATHPYAAPQPTTVVVQSPPPTTTTHTTVINEAPAAPSTANAKTSEQRLADLQGLLDKGLITESEYSEKRKAILDEL